jgi:hypothetical protein
MGRAPATTFTPLSRVINIFYTTMRQLEDTPGFQQGDPGVLELRKQVLKTIKALELSRDSSSLKKAAAPAL